MRKKREKWMTLLSGGIIFLEKRLPTPDEMRSDSRQMEKAYTGWPRKRMNLWIRGISMNMNPMPMKRK
jgi:hypothetical protein